MKKILTALMLLSLAACSSLKTSSDFDPSVSFDQYKQYAWVESSLEDAPYHLDGLMDQRIRDGLDRELAAKGFTKVAAENAQLKVNYFTKTDKKLNVQTFNNNFGYDPFYDDYAWGGGYSGGMSHSTTRVTERTIGTLVIDFVDAKTNNLVWRGTAADTVRDNDSPQETTEQINGALKELLMQYPPKPEAK